MDFTQNHYWDGDQYFNPIKIDLSHVWFVLSMNDEKLLPDVLRDRIDILNISGDNINEKIIMAKKFLLPEVFKNLGQNLKLYVFEDKSIDNIVRSIEQNNHELSGVRNIKHFLQTLASKLSLLRLHALYIYSKYGYEKLLSFNSEPKKKKIKRDNTVMPIDGTVDASTDEDDCQKSDETKKYLSKEQLKILKRIIKDTGVDLLEKKKIYISYKTLSLMKDNLIKDNFSAKNTMIRNMYM